MSKIATQVTSLKPDELDGILILRAALRYGFDVSVYPRQVLICLKGNGQELSFIHGLPGSSGLGPVTYAQDKRMRRALMERAGIPIPKGATFTLGRGVALSKAYAKRIGFPIALKPAIGDNGIETFRDIKSIRSMNTALNHLRKPTTERPNYTRAAYGLTELREPGIENGKRTVPPGYMFLVEKQHPGEYIRFLVINGEVVSAIRCEGYPVDASLTGGTQILDSVHPEILDLVVSAAKSIPGLPVVALDALVPAITKPADKQNIYFVEYSERPGLWVQAAVDSDHAVDLSKKIFTGYAKSKQYELDLSEDLVSVQFEAFAIPDANAGSEAMLREAERMGLSLTFHEVSQLEGTAKGTLIGDALQVATFVDAALEGKIDGAPVMLAKLKSSKQ